MNSYYIHFETLSNVANAIRVKKETSILMSPSKMIEEIQNINHFDTDIPPMAYEGDTISYFSSQDNLVLGYAFYGCSLLQSVNLPMASYIGGNAFNSCTSLQSVDLPMASYIGSGAFYSCSLLQSVNLPTASYIGYEAFCSCRSLQLVSLPVASYIGGYAFYSCSLLQSVNLPNASRIGTYAFTNCNSLQSVNLPMVSYIGYYVFDYCYNLLSLYLGSTSVCKLATSAIFNSTPIAGYTTSTGGVYGSIYVPASLLTSYKTATNWTVFSSRFVGV